MVLDTLVPQLSNSSSLYILPWCSNLFQPIKAITGIGTIESGNLLKSLVHMSALLVFSFL